MCEIICCDNPLRTRTYHNLPFWFPPLFFLLLAALFLWHSTFAGDVFLPANLLGHIAPWTSTIAHDNLPPWNPLRWDGIAQFYPWRNFAHDTLRSGVVPLWNPYQFCGTPFVANSQSAVFYPPNLLFTLLPTARAFGVSALLHLTLCGWFTYLFLRRLGCGEAGALLAGVTYAFSNWQVQWLQLPTFLATSCWFPLLLRQIYSVGERKKEKGESNCVSAFSFLLFPFSLTVGLMLLAGHLQIAFYGLLAGSLWGVALLGARVREAGVAFALGRLGLLMGGLVLGVMLALPQILPALELSRMSHRAGKPTGAGYALYAEYALPPADLALLTLPDFFGNDYDPGNGYYGFYVKHAGETDFAVRHNAAETAIYAGILPLLLALFAVTRTLGNMGSKSKGSKGVSDRRVLFFAILAVFALLLALGTPLNALFYFFVPGFAQSGSPARCLVLWALAIAVLAGMGLDSLLRQPPTKREAGIVMGAFGFVFAIGLSSASQALRANLPNMDKLKAPVLGEVIARIGADWVQLLVFTAAGVALLLWKVKPTSATSKPASTTSDSVSSASESFALTAEAASSASEPTSATAEKEPGTVSGMAFSLPALTCLALVIADVFLVGIRINPTAPASAVYPITPGIKFVQETIGHDHIFPVNKFWNLNVPPPAVLPPNAALVYGLRDVQGYDSLLTGQYKAFADQFARPDRNGDKNASPVEVGNMVFFQDPTFSGVPTLGAAYAVTLPPSAPLFHTTLTPPTNAAYDADNEMAVYPLPNALHRARLLGTDGLPLPAPASVSFLQDDATRVTLNVATPAPATLVLADQYYPGWHVTIDGKPADLQRSPENVFRAAAVPAGTHTIAFTYQPASYQTGLFLQCLACALLAIPGGIALTRPKQSRS